jgi:hypothetical protein
MKSTAANVTLRCRPSRCPCRNCPVGPGHETLSKGYPGINDVRCRAKYVNVLVGRARQAFYDMPANQRSRGNSSSSTCGLTAGQTPPIVRSRWMPIRPISGANSSTPSSAVSRLRAISMPAGRPRRNAARLRWSACRPFSVGAMARPTTEFGAAWLQRSASRETSRHY